MQIYDLNGHLLTETSAAATPIETDYVYLDDMPLSVIKPATPTVSYILTDRIGTPQFATSSTKATVWVCNYQPFGSCSPTASVTMNDRLPGMYNDFTVMNHNGFRDFHIGGDFGLSGGRSDSVVCWFSRFRICIITLGRTRLNTLIRGGLHLEGWISV